MYSQDVVIDRFLLKLFKINNINTLKLLLLAVADSIWVQCTLCYFYRNVPKYFYAKLETQLTLSNFTFSVLGFMMLLSVLILYLELRSFAISQAER